MPQDAIIGHGTISAPYEIESPKLKLRREDLDQLTLVYAAPSKDSFVKGQAAPGWSGFVIDDMSVEQDANEWIFTLECEGIYNFHSRRVKNGLRETDALANWDTYDDRWLTTNKNYFTKGQRAGNFVCTSVGRVERRQGANIWEVTGSFTGIRSGQGTRKRVCTSNGQVISLDQMIVNLENGWNTAQKGQVSLPKLLITDTYPSLTRPATQSVPSRQSPPSAPGVRPIRFVGTDVRRVWPSLWSFTCGYEQPFGLNVSLFMVTENYEFTLEYLPG